KPSMAYKSLGFRVSGFKLTGNARLKTRNRFACVPALRSIVLFVFIGLFFHADHGVAQERIRIAPSSPGLATWPIHIASKEGFFAPKALMGDRLYRRRKNDRKQNHDRCFGCLNTVFRFYKCNRASGGHYSTSAA